MAKKIVKRKKLRVFRLFVVLFVLVGLFLGIYCYLKLPVVNLVVKNTNYLNDDYILDLAKLKEYPSFWFTSASKIEKRLNASPYIKKSKVSRRFFHTFVISISENRALFLNDFDDTVVFENKKKILASEEIVLFRIPRLTNYVPDDKFGRFVSGMRNIKDDVLSEISDIEYVPNDYDKERFLLYMDDGNMVYLTLTKFKMINYYNDVLSQLEGRRGILYLDNGNHFQIKE